MNPAILILLPIIFAVFLAGGFSLNSPESGAYNSNPVSLLESGLAGISNGLQINSLIPVTTTPVPTIPGSSPTNTPAPNPTSPITPFCPGRKIAVDLLIDTSRTMYTNKMGIVKQALREFPKYISNQVIVGMQIFSSPIALGAGRAAITVLPIAQYNSSSYLPAVNGLPDSGEGSTYIRSGFELAQSDINSARSKNSGYEWFLIVLSDGMPESETPITGRPFGEEFAPNEAQNPNTPPSIAEQIKSSGVKIITIGLDLSSHDTDGRDLTTSAYARYLLQTAQNAGKYEPNSINELVNIYQEIARKSICNK